MADTAAANGCEKNSTLSTYPELARTCYVECQLGYRLSGGTASGIAPVTCAPDAAEGASPSFSATCTVNVCAPFLLRFGVVGASSTVDNKDTAACTDEIRLQASGSK